MARLSKTAFQRLWAVMTALLIAQTIHPAIGSVIRQTELRNEQLSKVQEVAKSHHLQKRGAVVAGIKYVLTWFWDDITCLGLFIGAWANCNSLTPGACQRLKDLDDKRIEVSTLVNETLETQIEWATLNNTNEKAIGNLQLIEKLLELVTESNLRLMGLSNAIQVIEETDDIYDTATDDVTETQIRFQVDLAQYISSITAILRSQEKAIKTLLLYTDYSFDVDDYVMFAVLITVPLAVLSTGHIVTSAHQAALSRGQSYQIVDFVGGDSKMKLAYKPSGGLYVVQESGDLGKLKVLQSVSDTGNIGRFWSYMTPAGQLAATTQFLESIDFERANKIVWLQQNDPDYLATLKEKGYMSAFLSRTDGLATSELDEWVKKAKTLDADTFYKYDPDVPADDLPKQLKLGLDILNPDDSMSIKAYNKLFVQEPDLLKKLNKAGVTGKFIDKTKALSNAEFDAYVAKIKAAITELPDGNLKNFDWDVPAKKVTFTQNIKNGWAAFRNFDMFNWRGRQLKISTFLTMTNIGGIMNSALCIALTTSSTNELENKIKEIDGKLDTAKTELESKKAELDSLLVDEHALLAKIKNNVVTLYDLFRTSDDSIETDPSCQGTTVCDFYEDSAENEVMSTFLSTWNNDTVDSSNILISQLDFMAALRACKTVMDAVNNAGLVSTYVVNWVTDGLTLDRMLQSAVSVNLDERIPDKYSILSFIKATFPSRTDYDGIPLSCIGASITTQAELDAFLAVAAPITGDVVNDIQTGVLFSIGVDGIVGMIASKVSSGTLPALPCNYNVCGRDEVLKVIAAQNPDLTTYDGVDLASYRSNASC